MTLVTLYRFQECLVNLKADNEKRYNRHVTIYDRLISECNIIINEISSIAYWYSMPQTHREDIIHHYNTPIQHWERLIDGHSRMVPYITNPLPVSNPSMTYEERINNHRLWLSRWDMDTVFYKNKEDFIKNIGLNPEDYTRYLMDYNHAIEFLDSRKDYYRGELKHIYKEVAILLAKGKQPRLGNDSLFRILNLDTLRIIMNHFMAHS